MMMQMIETFAGVGKYDVRERTHNGFDARARKQGSLTGVHRPANCCLK